MKSETRKIQTPVSETRKIRKPLMEKKRRARINDSLETLKQILLDSKTALRESPSSGGKKAGQQRTAKLEKADILEMTVHYIQNLKNTLEKAPTAKKEILIRPADSSTCNNNRLKVGITLVPTRLGNGDLAFVIPPSSGNDVGDKKGLNVGENVWRPW